MSSQERTARVAKSNSFCNRDGTMSGPITVEELVVRVLTGVGNPPYPFLCLFI